MREIDFAMAQAALSGLVDDAVAGESCIILRNGEKVAVLMSYDGWLSTIPSFGAMLASAPIEPGDIPERDRTPPREVEF